MRQEPTGYIAGTWKGTCQRCGFNHRNTALRLEWTGLRVCGECWEPRHPQDAVRGVADRQNPPWTAPEPTPIYIIPGSIITDDMGNVLVDSRGFAFTINPDLVP